jgi:hypothetical protein
VDGCATANRSALGPRVGLPGYLRNLVSG